MINPRQVWHHNLDLELVLMERAMTASNYVAIDTEYPGFLRTTPRQASPLKVYEDLKFNVDRLRPVQFGFTFFDSTGNISGVWQYNFSDFDPQLNSSDVDASTSLSLATRKSGIDFEKQRQHGINSQIFACKFSRILKMSQNNLKWITFHGIYDFAYMAKVITDSPLPASSNSFQVMIGMLFGSVYDIKVIAKFYPGLLGGELGLKKLSTLLKVPRTGVCHQAGSDSLVTARVFVRMKEIYDMDDKKFEGFVYAIEGRVERMKPRLQAMPVLRRVYHQPLFLPCVPMPNPLFKSGPLYAPQPSYIAYM